MASDTATDPIQRIAIRISAAGDERSRMVDHKFFAEDPASDDGLGQLVYGVRSGHANAASVRAVAYLSNNATRDRVTEVPHSGERIPTSCERSRR